MAQFERIMGAALREGYWQPEDYNDYGDKHLESYTCDFSSKTNIADGDDVAVTTHFFFDKEPFDGETLSYIDSFTIDNGNEHIYYPCIKIEGAVKTFVEAHPDDFSLVFMDVTDSDTTHYSNNANGINPYLKIYHIGS